MPMPAVILAAIGLLFALAGCAGLQGLEEGAEIAARPVAPMSREELLSNIAVCHLLRVGQTNDVAATDSTVIVAVDRHGVQLAQVIERSNQLLREYQDHASELIRRATEACQRLADETGVVSALVRFEPDGKLRTAWLRVDDVEIDPGFAPRTIAELRRRRAIGLVINSPGGSVYEARKLGRFLRANGLRTAVDRLCVSACVDVLAGGVERYASRDAKLGIHQSKVPHRYSTHEGGQLYVADSFRYLREMDIDPDVAIAAASVPNDKLLLIPLADAIETGLVTGVVEGFQ